MAPTYDIEAIEETLLQADLADWGRPDDGFLDQARHGAAARQRAARLADRRLGRAPHTALPPLSAVQADSSLWRRSRSETDLDLRRSWVVRGGVWELRVDGSH
jgi:hypothetical protein